MDESSNDDCLMVGLNIPKETCDEIRFFSKKVEIDSNELIKLEKKS